MEGSDDDRGSWRSTSFAAVVGATLAIGLTGCPQPADLENPPPCCGPNAPAKSGETDGGTGGTSGASGAGGAGPSCESACITRIFTTDIHTQCMICHGAAAPYGQLDLSLGFTARLKNKTAKHVEIDPKVHPEPMCPAGDLLINTASPAESWLWKKVNRMAGNCGDPMPAATPLTATDLACVKTYIECVSDGKSLVGTGGSAGGSGGATAGSGGSGGT